MLTLLVPTEVIYPLVSAHVLLGLKRKLKLSLSGHCMEKNVQCHRSFICPFQTNSRF